MDKRVTISYCSGPYGVNYMTTAAGGYGRVSRRAMGACLVSVASEASTARYPIRKAALGDFSDAMRQLDEEAELTLVRVASPRALMDIRRGLRPRRGGKVRMRVRVGTATTAQLLLFVQWAMMRKPITRAAWAAMPVALQALYGEVP